MLHTLALIVQLLLPNPSPVSDGNVKRAVNGLFHIIRFFLPDTLKSVPVWMQFVAFYMSLSVGLRLFCQSAEWA